jgi:glycosyltransferase involved in cell wall biosynthesis
VTGSRDGLRVAVLGGVPRTLGGGGLEIQIARTTAALHERGVDMRSVHAAPAEWEFDVLHVFGHTADVGHFLHHWRRRPAQLVVSPVVVVPPARERRLKLATRLPIPAFEPRVLRALTERADRLVALTEWEARLLKQIGGDRTARTTIVGNGVEPHGELPDRDELRRALGAELPDRYAIVVGAVSQRKRQADIARALAGVLPLVAVGGWEGADGERGEFERLVAATGGKWLGEISERRLVDALIAEAAVLVHLSDAEGQSLAVLEALALGTPCLLSALPQQREMAARWPASITLVENDADLAAKLRQPVEPAPQNTAQVPSWGEVADDLLGVYAELDGPARLWNDRG